MSSIDSSAHALAGGIGSIGAVSSLHPNKRFGFHLFKILFSLMSFHFVSKSFVSNIDLFDPEIIIIVDGAVVSARTM